MVSTVSPSGHGVFTQYQELNGIANWLEAQKSEAHYPLASAQSMTSTMHPLHHGLLPRALSAFPFAQQAAQPSSSSCDSGSEALGVWRSSTASNRSYSSGDRLQNLKRRQQVLATGNLLEDAITVMPLAVLCSDGLRHKFFCAAQDFKRAQSASAVKLHSLEAQQSLSDMQRRSAACNDKSDIPIAPVIADSRALAKDSASHASSVSSITTSDGESSSVKAPGPTKKFAIPVRIFFLNMLQPSRLMVVLLCTSC